MLATAPPIHNRIAGHFAPAPVLETLCAAALRLCHHAKDDRSAKSPVKCSTPS
jgi:hypothetical protein